MANLIVNIEDHSRPPDSLFSPLIISYVATLSVYSLTTWNTGLCSAPAVASRLHHHYTLRL